MKRNPWHPYVQAALKRVLPQSVYLRYVGRHEHGSLKLWREFAARSRGAILDIGAFHGEYALAAREANATAPIYAFEPNRESLAVLRAALAGHNIAVEAVAVSGQSGYVRFVERVQIGHIVDSGGIEVAAVTIDDWQARTGENVALIKIDTEGAEPDIIRGATNTLSRFRPVILCEVLSDDAGRRLMQALPDFYRYNRIDENRGTERRGTITREDWRHKNWLLLPE